MLLENKLQFFLWGWTTLAFIWWFAAFVLLRMRQLPREVKSVSSQELITIFKPSPSFQGGAIPEGCQEGLRSFFREMNDGWELLLGIDLVDRSAWDRFLKKVASDFPQARWRLIEVKSEALYPNPKVNRQRLLAADAQGKLWFWSDLDIQIPPGALEQIRREWEGCGDTYVTCAYRIRDSKTQAGGWDALFVNAEFLPGVCFLGRFGEISTGFGAGFLFHSKILEREEAWAFIGHSLADDRALAQRIGLGKLSSIWLETVPAAAGWGDSLMHYWRWQKTIHWCDPIGSGGRCLILPLLGWGGAHLLGYSVGSSVMVVWLMEVIVGGFLLRQNGFQKIHRVFLALLIWPGLRMLTWILLWLPLPVRWGKTWWWKSFQVLPKHGETISAL